MASNVSTPTGQVTSNRNESTFVSLRGKDQQFDYFVAGLLTLSIFVATLIWSEKMAHWFLVPLGVCGVLAGVDVVRLFRGKLEIFDPKALVSILIYYGFVVAPLLHVGWDRFGSGYDFKLYGDWREWLGAVAVLHAGGLFLFRFFMNFAYRHSEALKEKWTVEYRIAAPVLLAAWIISAGSQIFMVAQFGGVEGFITAFERNTEVFVGKGWILVLAWPLSVLSLIAFDLLAVPKVGPRISWLPRVIVVIAGAGILHLLVMGWYGSRSTTVWAIFWMAGILHYRYRKFRTGVIAVGTIFLVAFMYFYGFYKEKGWAGFEVVQSPSMWFQPKDYGRDLPGLLLGDLARADGTAYELYCLMDSASDYDYRWGLTYAGAFTLLIPRNFWPDRPEYKVEAGTELQHGKTAQVRSSKVYGLTGEALLNFGPVGIPVMMSLFGAAIGWYRKKLHYLSDGDIRTYLAPFFTIMYASAFIGDLDNVLFGALTEGAWIALLIVFITKRSTLPATSGRR